MASCTFCPRESIGNYTLTRLKGNPKSSASWERVVAPLCARCDRLLTDAGREGRVLKGTKERWFGGHGVGIFEATGRVDSRGLLIGLPCPVCAYRPELADWEWLAAFCGEYP